MESLLRQQQVGLHGITQALHHRIHATVLISLPPQNRITGAGIQDLTIEFPWSQTKPHLKEDGWNGVFFR